MHRLAPFICLTTLILGCSSPSELLDEFVEHETGCTPAQLGNLDEPALPNCSKAIACCKVIKGDCGQIKLFTAPQTILDACNAQESVLSTAISTYQDLKEGECPVYLTQKSCDEGLDKTRENYISVVDQGNSEGGSDTAPSCALIVQETVNALNDELGDSAKYLPEACERQ